MMCQCSNFFKYIETQCLPFTATFSWLAKHTLYTLGSFFVDTVFSFVSLCQEFCFSWESYFLNKNMSVVLYSKFVLELKTRDQASAFTNINLLFLYLKVIPKYVLWKYMTACLS